MIVHAREKGAARGLEYYWIKEQISKRIGTKVFSLLFIGTVI